MPALSFTEAAYEILNKKGQALSANEISQAALSQGLILTSGKTPSATMGARLYMDIKQKGNDSRFFKEGKGKFGKMANFTAGNRI